MHAKYDLLTVVKIINYTRFKKKKRAEQNGHNEAENNRIARSFMQSYCYREV